MASSYLSRTFDQVGNRRKWTWSGWYKRTSIGSQGNLFATSSGSTSFHLIYFDGNNKLAHNINQTACNTNAAYTDTAAWYHVVFTIDTAQATASDRIKIYVNGVQQTTTGSYPSQNSDMTINTTVRHDISNQGAHYSNNNYYDGAMAHLHFCDGYAYAASDFGETDSTTGIWKPKTSPSVTYGTNGFFLKMDNSANMGLDSGGGAHNFTTSGTILQYKDTPSNNMPQLNNNDKYAAAITNAGHTVTNESNSATGVMSTLAVKTGKWYWEAKVEDSPNDYFNVGMRKTGQNNYNVNDWAYSSGAFVYAVNGYIYKDGSQSTNTGTTAAVGDIIGFIVDLDAGTVKLQKNGANMYSGNAVVTGLNTGDFWHVVQGASNSKASFNFGNGYFGTTAITSAGSNGNGLLFEYDVPSGHYGISTKNMAGNS
jgi:hypothetical protein|tara:strand:+ start:365 stop:1639 length:1275 start_codon:yes stop_codon:yes gene_type:complete